MDTHSSHDGSNGDKRSRIRLSSKTYNILVWPNCQDQVRACYRVSGRVTVDLNDVDERSYGLRDQPGDALSANAENEHGMGLLHEDDQYVYFGYIKLHLI